MLIIPVEPGKIGQALKTFKRKFERVGILKTVRGRKEFEKPSVRKRKARIKAIYKQQLYAKENY